MINASENILLRITVNIKVLQLGNQPRIILKWQCIWKMALICNACISNENYRKNLKKQGNWFSKKVSIQKFTAQKYVLLKCF